MVRKRELQIRLEACATCRDIRTDWLCDKCEKPLCMRCYVEVRQASKKDSGKCKACVAEEVLASEVG